MRPIETAVPTRPDGLGEGDGIPLPAPDVERYHIPLTVETDIDRKYRMLTQLKRTCYACSLCELGRKPVTQDGRLFLDPHVFSTTTVSSYFVVGQNPGWNELRRCEPFVGQAGDNFDAAIKRHGKSRDDFYICNSVRCYTPGNAKPDADHLEACHNFLEMEIRLLRPRLIIALGQCAIDALCDGVRFGDVLGEIVHSKYNRTPVFVAYHPSPLNLADAGRRKMFNRQIALVCALIDRLNQSPR